MKPQLIICADGLGFDLISKENTPFLYRFGKENHIAELETLFAFTGIEYCFFTGKNPNETGIWLEFSKENNSVFNSWLMKFFGFGKLKTYVAVFLQLMKGRTWMSGVYNIPKKKLRYFDTSAKRGLWELEFFKDKKFAFYKWPFFAEEKGRRLVFKYENDEERLRRLLSAKRKDIYYVQLMKVDKALHKFGKGSSEAEKALKSMDLLLEKSVKKFIDENAEGEVILWGDHSLANIKNYINLQKMLPERRDYLCFIEGTTASFWFANEDAKKSILESVKKEGRIKVLAEKKAKEYNIPLSKKYGDLVLYVEKGDYFFPNFYQKSEKEKFNAMHGYPDDKEMNGVVISSKKIPKKIKMADMIKYLR